MGRKRTAFGYESKKIQIQQQLLSMLRIPAHLPITALNSLSLWYPGMWETLHLFSRYAKNFSGTSVSNLENAVSAYTTVNETADSMTVILVNRDMVSLHTTP